MSSPPSVKTITAYHTQEHRGPQSVLKDPLICNDHNAWLGNGYYFWKDELFAHYWGEDMKCKSPHYSYDVYSCELDVSNVLDTTFNEKDYNLFVDLIQMAVDYFKKFNLKSTLDALYQFCFDHFKNLNLEGIIYDDQPRNPKAKNRKYSKIWYLENKQKRYFYYLKRIQIVIYDINLVSNFQLYKTILNQRP